jgi:hypothetical protein
MLALSIFRKRALSQTIAVGRRTSTSISITPRKPPSDGRNVSSAL